MCNPFIPTCPQPDPPSKPGKPEVKDYDRTWALLKWAIPESDGGSPITSYIIEKKDRCVAFRSKEPKIH